MLLYCLEIVKIRVGKVSAVGISTLPSDHKVLSSIPNIYTPSFLPSFSSFWGR